LILFQLREEKQAHNARGSKKQGFFFLTSDVEAWPNEVWMKLMLLTKNKLLSRRAFSLYVFSMCNL